jgi:hypothetical protein
MSGHRRKIAFGDLYVLRGEGTWGIWPDRQSYTDGPTTDKWIGQGDLIVFLERTNNRNNNTINLKILTRSGIVGWIMNYSDRWFRYDFSIYKTPCQH